MSKSYIKVCEQLSQMSGVLTPLERNAISNLIQDAKKWRRYEEKSKVKSEDLKKVIYYYLDKKEIPLERRSNVVHMLRPAKSLLNKCNKDVELCKRVIDQIAVEFAELNWSINAVDKHADRVLNK